MRGGEGEAGIHISGMSLGWTDTHSGGLRVRAGGRNSFGHAGGDLGVEAIGVEAVGVEAA